MNSFNVVINQASELDIFNHLERCSNLFNPPLKSYVNLTEYSKKIESLATTFEIWENDNLICLSAVYMNNKETKNAFITNTSVEENYQGMGLASLLLKKNIEKAIEEGLLSISLNVRPDNISSIRLHEKYGFELTKSDIDFIEMTKQL
jgi:GNAT superfamily N-acetyltransferase